MIINPPLEISKNEQTFELGPRLNLNSRSNSFDQLREATLASLGEPQPRVRARHRTLAYGVDELDLDK